MPQKVIKFKGINRRINEFQCSGECEELINVRSMPTGLEIVKPKKVTIENARYERVYVHAFGEVNNQIAVSDTGTVYWLNPKEGQIETITESFTSNDVVLSFAGNVLLAYSKDNNKQLVFKYEDDDYKAYELSMPDIIDAHIHYGDDSDAVKYTVTSQEDTLAGYNSALNSAFSGFHTNFPHALCGAAVVGCTYELEDGSELWSTAFVVANPSRVDKCGVLVERVHKTVTVAGVNVHLSLSLSNFKDSSVRKINIYASRPVSLFKLKDDAINYDIVPLSDVNLDGQLMYFQGSISPDDDTSFALDFGSTQAGERVMEVTPGCIERVGKAVSYNNRFHFFNSDVNHVKQSPTISNIDNSDSSSPWIPYAMFGDKWKIINKTLSFSANSKLDIIYPLAEVKKMAFVKARWGSNGYLETPYEQMFYVDLKESSAYNYAYAFDVAPSLISASSFYNQMRDEGQLYSDTTYKTVTLRRETNSVNVSAQYNPFVFPVKHSYAFGGEVLDIATSYLPISSTQIGQYPLSVFTSNGIYALEQGSGATLYGNIVPLQPHVIDGKAVATPYGTFFISSKGLYILVGREATKVSDALEGTREIAIRDNEAYNRLYCNNRSPLYDFSRLLSSKDFEEFTDGAILAYDQLQNELYICSPSTTYYYSYVFNLNTKAFHKVSRKYIATNGCRYAVEVIGGERNIVDLHTEDKIDNQTILLQSRPMPIETFFTHLQRLILLADAKLTRNQNLCLTVFGSDNLDNWKCIISSQKADTTFRQIRTNKAAKSYRDYIIVISGTLDTSTDISDLIADYTVVTRRLG